MIETERLILRPWKDSDLEPVAQLNSDPVVMELMFKSLSREESDAWVARMKAQFVERGFSHYAAELKEDGSFVGAIGLSVPSYQTPFSPFVEIGWRIAHPFWNQGLATEGACAVLKYSHEALCLPEVVAFTVPANVRSRRVMEKIGMVRDLAADFDHPNIPEGHALRRHVLYRWSWASAMDREASRAKMEVDG
jgi:RimJ/RimL family protein N-acetyltransferase